MQFTSTKKPPPGIVFDSDFGNRIDSVLALGLLHGLEGKNFGRISSISVSKSNLKSAQLADVIEKFYAGPSITGAFGGTSFQAQSIGMAVDGKLAEDTPILSGVLSAKGETGAATYSPRIARVTDTAIVEALIRNALTANYDGNAVVVLDGPATNLVRLLDLVGAKELIAAKVKLLVLVGGTYSGSGGAPDPCFRADIPAIRRLLAEWPSPVVLSGREVGAALPYPGSSIDKDFTAAPANPIPASYRCAGAMPYDAPAPALAAALYALRPDQGFFRLSEPGSLRIADDGASSFQAAMDGRCRYLIVDPAQSARVTGAYVELVTAAPVRRFRRPLSDAAQADDKKAEPKVEKQP